MEVKYNLKKEDYINFNMEYLVNSSIVKKFFYFQKILMALLLFLALFVVRKRYGVSILYLLMMYIIVYFGWAAMEGFFIRFIMKKKLAKDLDKKPRLVGEKILILMEDGIREKSRKEDFLVSWEHVKFIEELDNYIYIFTSLNSGYIIPKKNLDKLEAKKILEFLKSKIKN